MKPLLLVPSAALFLAAYGHAQCPGNDGYGNTSSATPYLLGTGYTFVSGLSIVGTDNGNYNAPSDAQDIFTLTLADGASIQVDADYDFSESALYGQLYLISNAALLASTDPNTQVISFGYTNTTGAAQDVLLKITSGAAFQGCGNYDLSVLVDACPGDDQMEPNDSCSTASYFGFATSPDIPELQRLSSQDGNDDWFEVDIPSGATIDASILFEHAVADMDLQITGPGGGCGSVLQTSESTTDNESVSWTNTTGAAATIGLRAYFFGSAAGNTCCNYELEFDLLVLPDDEFEDNDTICAAAAPVIGVYSDLLVYDGDSDFYKLIAPNGSRAKFAIDFDHSAGDLDLRLWDITQGCAGAILVDQSESVTDYEEVSFENTQFGLGEYAVEVFYFPNDGGSNDYSLTVALGDISDLGEQVCRAVVNSTGLGAETFASGSAFVGDNDVLLRTNDLPSNAFGFYNTSMGFRLVENPGGSSGDLCIAGAPIGRYVGPGQILNSGSAGSFQMALDLNSMPQPSGPVGALSGETWFFQAWYRDSSPAGPTSNFSGAIRILFE